MKDHPSMVNEVLFTERQRFRQWWLWLILLSINGFFLFTLFQSFLAVERAGGFSDGFSWSESPMNEPSLWIAAAVTTCLTLFFAFLRLDTTIKKDGIYVRFFPFHRNSRFYSWDTLTKSFIRQYSPIAEFGGWGLRLGGLGKVKAYNIAGDMGLQLEFSNHSKLLIGTNKPKEMEKAIASIGQLKQ